MAGSVACTDPEPGSDTTVRWNERLRDLQLNCRPALALLVPFLLVIAIRHGGPWWIALALDLASFAIFPVDRRNVQYGWLPAVGSLPGKLLRNFGVTAGKYAAEVREECRKDRQLPFAALAFLGLILVLQWAGGAYRAEFDGDPDEASHLISGLMVYDYLASLPAGNPIVWAEQYYLHYPKVAIGHWPPLFYVVEGLWELMIPPSRWSVLLLEAAITLAAALAFYRLANRQFAPWPAVGATLLLLVCPVTQQGFDMVMADSLCLLWSVLFLNVCVQLTACPSARKLAMGALWISCALLTKGTAICLVPVIFLVVAVSGKWNQAPLAGLAACAGAILVCGGVWYSIEGIVLHQNLRYVGGLDIQHPWTIGLLPGLAGWGICLLAIGGCAVAPVRRRPAALASLSIMISAVLVSSVVRAMNQPRHWIIVLPALLMLSLEFMAWLTRWKGAVIAAIALALGLLPWTLFRQQPEGFTALAAQLKRPARVLVSSNASGEGAMIAAIALSEPRPSSVVVRASKSLASSGWNGSEYRLLAGSPAEVGRLLDEMGIDQVELHTKAGVLGPPHHELLQSALHDSPLWRRCGQPGAIEAWRRVSWAGIKRKPLKIDLTDKIGLVVQEPETHPGQGER